MLKITRCKANPILQNANDLPWCRGGVRNPSAVADGNVVRMLFTANWKKGDPVCEKMRLGYAQSNDGVNFECRPEPFLDPSDSDSFFDRTGIDDPRITPIDGSFYFTYASPAPIPDISTDMDKNEKPMWLLNLRRSGLARTDDWRKIERLGPITSPIMGDANVVLFPEKINGKYAILHRPTPFTPWFAYLYYFPAAIWLCYSDDLLDWGWNRDWDTLAANANKLRDSDMADDQLLIRPEFTWESLKIGASGVPIPTDDGWLMIYHAVDRECVYRVGLMLLDRTDPRKVIARSAEPIMEPQADYEVNGRYPSEASPQTVKV